jgi:hypothetical protein
VSLTGRSFHADLRGKRDRVESRRFGFSPPHRLGVVRLNGGDTPIGIADLPVNLVMWKPENFGAKPELVLKGGVIAWSNVSVFVVQRGVAAMICDMPWVMALAHQ